MNYQEYVRIKKVDKLLERYGLELRDCPESTDFVRICWSYDFWPHKRPGEHALSPHAVFEGRLEDVECFFKGVGFLENLLKDSDMIPENFIAKALKSSQQKHLIKTLSGPEILPLADLTV